MSMFERRQEQRLRLLLVSPAVIVLLIAAFAVVTARLPGNPPRETMFDLMTRLAPRPASELPTAIVVVDEDSVGELGAWPWPRSVLGDLIDHAEAAGALSVTLTVAVSGDDPLSPDVVARRWMEGPTARDEAARLEALAALPSNDLLLARAAAGGPVGLALAANLPGTAEDVTWERTGIQNAPWLTLTGEGPDGEISLPAIAGSGTLSAELREARLTAVAGLPADPDGRIRRVAPLMLAGDLPAATSGLAALAASGVSVTAERDEGLLSSSGPKPSVLVVGNAGPMPLDGRGELRLWLPASVDVPSVPAWRLLSDPDAWGASLDGKHVFIGEAVSEAGTVETSRGDMPIAQAHALVASQLHDGATVSRPLWSGFAEASSAVFFGSLAALAVIFLPAAIAVAGVVLLIALGFAGAYLLFQGTGLLLDPSPAIFAAIGGPLAVGATVLTNMAIRDDAVRGAFHGALPQKVMRQVQSRGGGRILHGVHRDVTVLSCAFRLPPSLIERFKEDPRDFVLFQASANDRLRRTILDHEGTVDYGEDGRLLGYWNVPLDAPKHIELACACALKMLDDVSAMSQQVSESHHVAPGGAMEELSDGRIEIGIATGPCFAGPVGLGGRNRYAALGQPVSFAGRLRARSPLYGPAILTDARVHDALRHHYAFLDLDYVRRDEEAEPEVIYGLVGNPFLKASKTFRDLADVQRDMLEAWRTRDLTAATRQLQKLRGVPGVPQPYVELFERRIMNARLSRARRDEDLAEVLGP